MNNRTFGQIFPSLYKLNKWKNKLLPDLDDLNNEEYLALIGKYAKSTIAYDEEVQFMANFFIICRERLPKLRKKLELEDKIRTMNEEEAMRTEETITNEATNPDTEPSEDTYEPLPYVNRQSATRGRRPKLRGLVDWKSQLGGNAYSEFVDAFRKLFISVITEERITVYGD